MSRFNFSLLPTSPLTNGKIRTGDLFNCRRWTIGLIQQSYKFGSFPSLHKANHIVHLRLLGKELHDLNQRPNEQGNWTNHNATTLPWNMFWPLPHRALYNRRNFPRYIIPPILGAFCNKEKNILFIVIEQTISQ